MQADQTVPFTTADQQTASASRPVFASLVWVLLTILACAGALWQQVEIGIVLIAGALAVVPAILDIFMKRDAAVSDASEIWVVFAWLGLALIGVWASGAALSPLSVLLALGPLYAFSVGRFRLGVEASVFAALGFLGVSALDELGYGLPATGGLGILPGLGALISVLQIGVFIAAAGATVRVREGDRRLLKTWQSTLWGVPVLVLRLDQNGHVVNWLGNQKILAIPEEVDLTKYGVVDIFTNSEAIRSVDTRPIRLTPVWNDTRSLEARLLRAPGGYRMVITPVTEAFQESERLKALAETREGDLAGQAKWIASLGHELRNMLNPVSGYTDLLLSERSGELGDSNKEFVRSIKQGAEHLSLLIEDLMTATKSRAGHLNLTVEELELREEIEGAIRLICWQAEGQKISLLLADGPDLRIVADRKALRQVLINLLSNAIKYSHPEGRVTVSVRRQDDFACVEIRDEGDGMSEADLARIGEAFFQGENARGRVGTGLGLTIVTLLTEAMDGRFELASEQGEGTTARIWLKTAAADQASDDVDEATKAAEAS